LSEEQERYWQELYDLKVHVSYLEIHLLNSESIDKKINIFLSIASSGSIASWAIWKEYEFIWASVIVLSQFINAIKPFLPYGARIKSLSKALREMEILSLEYEEKWFYIANGEKTEEEIHKLRFEIKNKKQKIISKYFSKNILPTNKKYLEEAETLVQEHISNYYN